MHTTANLWAVAYNDVNQAEQVRALIARLDERGAIKLLDTAVLVCHADGTVILEGEPFVPAAQCHVAGTIARFLASLALAVPPLTGRCTKDIPRIAGLNVTSDVGISEDFIREVQPMMRPGTSTLFVLDEVGDMEAVLREVQGLGGSVLKTNVDFRHAKMIQSALSAT